ncbi:MAG TPA: YceI family protein [Candidatus Limnocylindria bacterium]|jgi:polyisoprenoid-binding protein YceI|nr:YceI family protein [Candidatus Limnocylindria bacterium]
MPSRIALALVPLAALVSCAAPQATSPTVTVTSPPTATATASASALPVGARRFAVVPERSLATIRVREQVAAIPAPGDAILTTRAFSGAVVLLPDGAFASGSAFAADLDTLKSDEPLRDEWIKFNTLNTRVYPRAEFTLLRVIGLPLPLASQGEWAAALEGTMKIHGVERPLSWPVQVTRSAGEVRVRGKTEFVFGDYGMAVPANRLILSVVDNVRLEVDLVAREG